MKLAIFDLDGTVIDSEHRKVALPNGDIDLAHWRENCTAEKIAKDDLLELVHVMRDLYDKGVKIAICTARVLSQYDFNFFVDNAIPFHYVLSRPHDCDLADAILKAQQIPTLLKKIKISRSEVQMWDDNPSVISAVNEIGVKCHDAKKFNHK